MIPILNNFPNFPFSKISIGPPDLEEIIGKL